ncbi:site-specific DNA-methyltransferase [Alkalihalobacillus clausii]|uniref:DNA-methyltransferase n=1 Tax=Shouchella clausii TaxID=79880 RepID=UPI001C222660|nr:DNA methyltransferase [Shouchella clausii]MBU8597347.1 site-specific DNA-methyltransferase [Shouchella clausii]
MTEVIEGIELNRVYNEDCLIGSERIESGSIDLILTDLPYGTVASLGESGSVNHGMKGKTAWDMPIEPSKIYKIANRILRKNGKMALFSQEPYTTRLITETIPNVPFSYRMIWEKDHFANSLIAKKAPVSYYEDVLVFNKNHQKHDFEGVHPLRSYFEKVMKFIGLTKKQIIDSIGQRADHTFRTGSTQFSLCTERTYNELTHVFKINEMVGFIEYADLKRIDVEYRQDLVKRMNEEFPSVFNLWEGGKFKSNILRYKKDYDGYHPTQKPVLLLEDLIKTFSNEGDTVVDLTIGSGSTAVAAINTDRNFIGFELEKEYVDIANKRIAEAIEKRKKDEKEA